VFQEQSELNQLQLVHQASLQEQLSQSPLGQQLPNNYSKKAPEQSGAFLFN
jgi:hypothetical protein